MKHRYALLLGVCALTFALASCAQNPPAQSQTAAAPSPTPTATATPGPSSAIPGGKLPIEHF